MKKYITPPMSKKVRLDKLRRGREPGVFKVWGAFMVCGVFAASLFGPAAAAPAISSKAIGAKPSPEIPKYVSTVKDWGERYNFAQSTEGLDWLLLGLQTRVRVENFNNF